MHASFRASVRPSVGPFFLLFPPSPYTRIRIKIRIRGKDQDLSVHVTWACDGQEGISLRTHDSLMVIRATTAVGTHVAIDGIARVAFVTVQLQVAGRQGKVGLWDDLVEGEFAAAHRLARVAVAEHMAFFGDVGGPGCLATVALTLVFDHFLDMMKKSKKSGRCWKGGKEKNNGQRGYIVVCVCVCVLEVLKY